MLDQDAISVSILFGLELSAYTKPMIYGLSKLSPHVHSPLETVTRSLLIVHGLMEFTTKGQAPNIELQKENEKLWAENEEMITKREEMLEVENSKLHKKPTEQMDQKMNIINQKSKSITTGKRAISLFQRMR
ncbi:hypothetical protein QQP08_024388 [Theobroma cacao]|nr:hypothetical protein QQP08_024388 [Theobroma cacao]